MNRNPTFDLPEIVSLAHDTVHDFTWKDALTDLSDHLAPVPSDEIRYLIGEFEAGRINGRSMCRDNARCGCIVATLGEHIDPVKSGLNFAGWKAFEQAYHGGQELSVYTAFQEWLKFVHSGEIPQTNPIAAAFVQALQAILENRQAVPLEIETIEQDNANDRKRC